MSPFFPQRNMTSQAQTPPSLGARTQHRIDSGVSMPRPKYERYQYYSQNSLKERKRILAKSERELAQKLDRTGFVSTDSLPSTHPFHGLRTVQERRGYWNTLPTYSGSSLPWPPATPEGQKKKKDVRSAFEGDVQEKIIHFDSLSLSRGRSEGSFRAESVTTFSTAAAENEEDRRVVSPLSAVWTMEHGRYVDRRAGTSATFDTTEDGEYARKRIVTTPGMSVATLDTANDGAYGRESNRAVVRDGDERPIIVVPQHEAEREEKASLLNGLFRRPRESRMPPATVPVPGRFNVKPLWGRKEVLEFKMQEKGKMESGKPIVEKVASKTPAVEKRLPTLSHHKRRSGSSNGASTPLPTLPYRKRGLESSDLSSTNVVAGSSSNTANRRTPTLQYHSMTLPSRSSKATSKPSPADAKSQRPRISDAASFEERLRYTTLDDLPLGEGGAKRISQLMREVEGDKYGTWPQPKPKRAGADDEDERHAPPAQQTPSNLSITEQVQRRLAQLDDEVARQCEEERAQRRREEEQRRRQEDRAHKRRRDEREHRRREETRSSTISTGEMVIPPFRPGAPSRSAPPAHRSPPVHPALQSIPAPQVDSPPSLPPHRSSSPSSTLNVLFAQFDGPPAPPRPRPAQPTSPPNLEIPSFVPPAVNPYLDAERPPTRRAKPRRRSRRAGFVDSSGTLKPAARSSLRHVLSAESVASGMESIYEGLYGSGGGDEVAKEEEYDHPFSPGKVEGAS